MNADTLEKMRRRRLLGMHRAFKTSLESTITESLTADELIALLVDSECDDRHNRTYKATMEQLEYSPDSDLDKN